MAFKNTVSQSSFLSPQPPEYAQATQEVLPIYASEHPAFDLLYHPLRWDWIAGRWLPQLRRLARSPGSQNVDKDGSVAMAHALAGQEGWVVVPHTITPETGDYVVAYPARMGRAHFFRWERIKLLGGRPSTTCDEAGYADWLSEVVDRMGLSPDPDVLQWKIEALESELKRDEAGAPTDLKAAARARETKARLDSMKAALQGEPQEPVVEATTPSPRRKS